MNLSKVNQLNFLILRGVTPTYYITKSVDNKSEKSDEVEYTVLPKRFTSVNEWPQTSNLSCWYCDLIPESYPAFIPINLEKSSLGNDTCDVYGHFNTWNCAVRYVINQKMGEFPEDQKPDILHAISIFASKFSGKKKEKIVPSPPKTLMKQYCGNSGITEKQYMERIQEINNQYDLGSFKITDFSV
jgi:hypothetical protein